MSRISEQKIVGKLTRCPACSIMQLYRVTEHFIDCPQKEIARPDIPKLIKAEAKNG